MSKQIPIELRGAELALEEARRGLFTSLHPGGRDEGKKGDDADGRALAQRCHDQIGDIQRAIDRWHEALIHRDLVLDRVNPAGDAGSKE